MLISVIVCTYVRAKALTNLLRSLCAQTSGEFEVLVVDGSGPDSAVRDAVSAFNGALRPRLISCEKGLTRQRNRGIHEARGEILAFLDDDVTVEPDFISRVASLFLQPEFEDVGGITGYDVRNYPVEVTLRWRLRRVLRIVPPLVPGAIDRLGRAVPISFLTPFTGFRDVGYLPGFCMIYRRSAIAFLAFDEDLPTYAGEDRDFSFAVGRRWRLAISGDLRLRHHYAPQSRVSDGHRVYQDGYGSGRMFAKHAVLGDRLELVRFLFCDLAVSLLAALQRPSLYNVRRAAARTTGIIAGYRSWNAQASRMSSKAPTRESQAE